MDESFGFATKKHGGKSILKDVGDLCFLGIFAGR
jgi:hypothetical protein